MLHSSLLHLTRIKDNVERDGGRKKSDGSCKPISFSTAYLEETLSNNTKTTGDHCHNNPHAFLMQIPTESYSSLSQAFVVHGQVFTAHKTDWMHGCFRSCNKKDYNNKGCWSYGSCCPATKSWILLDNGRQSCGTDDFGMHSQISWRSTCETWKLTLGVSDFFASQKKLSGHSEISGGNVFQNVSHDSGRGVQLTSHVP